MAELTSFLQAILDEPLDDTPRLIFADWLQDQADSILAARGELMRVQCQLSSGREATSPRRTVRHAVARGACRGMMALIPVCG